MRGFEAYRIGGAFNERQPSPRPSPILGRGGFFLRWRDGFRLPLPIGKSAGAVEGWEPGLSILVAIVLGSCASGVSNSDLPHRILRRLRLTRETSYPSEFYSTFAQYGGSFVVLHLRGDRRLYGYAKEWPSDPKDGHFCVTEAEWLADDNERTPLEGVAAVLVPATEVVMVEFLPYTQESE